MERRSRFFGALAGVGLVLGLPAYKADKNREGIESKARIVMDIASEGREGELAPERTTEEMVASLRTYQARYGPIESYQAVEAHQPFYGPPEVLGLVKGNQTWFPFTFKRSPDGRAYGYEETLANFPE